MWITFSNHLLGVVEISSSDRVPKGSDEDLTHPPATVVRCEIVVFRMRGRHAHQSRAGRKTPERVRPRQGRWQRSLDMYREVGDRKGVAESSINLGQVCCRERGEHD